MEAEEADPTRLETDFRDAASAVIGRRMDELALASRSVLDLDRPDQADAMVLATARLRAAVEFFEPTLDRTQYRGIRKEVRDLEEIASGRRELDAAIGLASSVGDEMEQPSRQGIDLLVETLDERRMEANRRLAVAIDERRLQALRLRLEDLLGGIASDGPAADPGRFVVPAELPRAARRTVARRLGRLRRRAPKAIEDGFDPGRSLVAAARLRYVLELSGVALGGQADTARRAARGLQAVLTEVVDCDRTLPLVEDRIEALTEADATTIRERGRGSRSLDPVLVLAAPHRDAYRGLALLSVDLRARREVEFERFRRLWLEQARQGVWVALEASLTGE